MGGGGGLGGGGWGWGGVPACLRCAGAVLHEKTVHRPPLPPPAFWGGKEGKREVFTSSNPSNTPPGSADHVFACEKDENNIVFLVNFGFRVYIINAVVSAGMHDL